MMEKRESDDGLRDIFRSKLPEFDWCIVETGPTTPGVPDTNAAGYGVEFWIEMKATSTHMVKFRPFQVPWIHRRVRAGGRVWIAIRRRHAGGPRRGPPVDDLWLVSGRIVLFLHEHGIRRFDEHHTQAFCWRGGPREWNWTQVRSILTGPF